MIQAEYKVVKTSTGKFRIIAVYSNGSTSWCGGRKSKKYCYTLESAALAQADYWNLREIELQNYVVDSTDK